MIDEKSIKNNLKDFSFPRLSGTRHEKKAFQMALKKVEELNLRPIIQEFEFSTFFARTYPKLVFLFGFLLLFFNFLNISTPFIPIISIILLSLILVLFILMRKPENVRFPKRLNSANLYVKLQSDQEKNTLDSNNRKKIIFFCHLDSKGQRFSILARVRAIRAWVFSALTSCIIIILKNFIFPNFSLVFLILGSFSMLITTTSTIMILLNSTNNLSHGVIDNATGIACVFELLSHYLDSQLLNYDLWFVFTGCEECGTMGIRSFYRLIENFDRDSTIIINFDAIGKIVTMFEGKYKPEGVIKLYDMFLNNEKGLRFLTNPKKISFGTHSDGFYLKKKLFQGLEFGDINSYQYMHSIEDNLDKSDPKLLKILCEVIIDNLKKLDNE